tara:strand:- start:106 stop:252 length:147 start_codon:yes stop_codon:yes gene_type:complete
MKIYDVTLSYPIKVKARDEDHVKEIILADNLLGDAGDLTITIKENEDE